MTTTAEGPPPNRVRVDVAALPLADQVYETLHGWILDGQLAPGHRLRVREVADMVGTSVMPVRDAVRRLVEAGLVTHQPYKGARVRALDLAELEQAYGVRILLEGEAARVGAENATPAVVEAMQECWEALDRAARDGDVIEALRQDEAMLDCLYSAADNAVLHDLVRTLWGRCRAYKTLWARTAANPDEPHIWHYKPQLVEAARSKDGASARAVIEESYGAARATIAHILGGGSSAGATSGRRRDM